MRLRSQRTRHANEIDDYSEERPLPDAAPEQEEASPPPSTRRRLSARDHLAITRRSLRAMRRHNLTNLSAALAYYAFLAIPSALLIAVGVLGLLGGRHAVTTIIDKLHGIVPDRARSLLQGSLTQVTQHRGTGIAVLVVGAVLALWSLTGAAGNTMWAMNIVYERRESRGFLRKRAAALAMITLALLGFGLCVGVLALGPHLSIWVGKAVGARRPVEIAWWIAEWPLLVAGLLLVFSGMLRFGPDVERRRRTLLSVGAVIAVFVWLAASGAFALYVSRFGQYNKSWGALSAVVVMLTWLWLSNLALLLGAEVDAEAERGPRWRRRPEVQGP